MSNKSIALKKSNIQIAYPFLLISESENSFLKLTIKLLSC